MSPNTSLAKILRFLGILLMGLASGFTLLGGVGTTCVALDPTGFGESMAKLAPFQWLYILFVLAGVLTGLLGLRATVRLVRGAEGAYRQAVTILVVGIAVGIVHMLVSRALRGQSMPVDAVVYTSLLTLFVFLLFRIPSIWRGVNFSKSSPQTNRPAGGAAAIIVGLLAFTVQYWMGPTHTWNGVNYAGAFDASMTVIGSAALLLGAGLLIGSKKIRTWSQRILLTTRS